MSAATHSAPIHVEPLDVLFEAPRAPGEVRGDDPPLTIAQRYGGPLAIGLRPDRPTLWWPTSWRAWTGSWQSPAARVAVDRTSAARSSPTGS